MQQVRIFKGLESESAKLEAELNQWLQQSGAKIVQIFGNIAPQSSVSEGRAAGGLSGGSKYAPSDIVVIVLYEAG